MPDLQDLGCFTGGVIVAENSCSGVGMRIGGQLGKIGPGSVHDRVKHPIDGRLSATIGSIICHGRFIA